MKYFIFFSFLFICTGVSAQCVSHTTTTGEHCGNPNSMRVVVENNCTSEKYVVALCYDENREVYKLLRNYVESGEKLKNWTCECTGLVVKYWDASTREDSREAYKAGVEYIERCKANNFIE